MTELAARLSAEDAAEYSESLAQIGEGWWRQIAWAFQQRIPESLGMSRQEWRNHYYGHVQISAASRAEIVDALCEMGMSNRAIADALGINERTVRNDRSGGAENSADNDEKPSDSGPPADGGAENSAPGDDDEDEDDAPSDDGDEWYTPRWLFDALGLTFSIDVCAPRDLTHTCVPADRVFTLDDDGLAQTWHGTVWCNPPYSTPEPWARRMIHHDDGLLLTHMPINAGWCVDMWEACAAVRLFQAMEFVRPDGSLQRPGYWLVLAAFGQPATAALQRLQPLGRSAANKRRVASPMLARVRP